MAPGTLARKIWIGLAITIAFLAATIFLVSLPASRFTDPAGREYAAAVARFVVGLIAIFAIRKLNWDSNALSSPSSRAWLIVVPVAVYSLIVYPLLFTGTLALNLSQPSLAGGVALNGFAAGALEELVFRGLILSLLLNANSDDQRLSDVWRAILISSVLFSVPHVLNLFAGHAEARVRCTIGMGISARGRVRMFENCGQIDLAGCSFARRDERVRSCQPARNRNSTIAVACRGTGFRPNTIMHLWRDSVA